MIRVYDPDAYSGVVAASCVARDVQIVRQIDIHWDSAATVSESLTITINSNAGSTHDILVYTVDPSVSSITDLHITADGEDSPLPIYMVGGDSLDIAYANTEENTIGISVYYEV